MASGAPVGGDGGSRDMQRWAAEGKVYTRKSLNKSTKSSNVTVATPLKPIAPLPATSDDASSSLNRPKPQTDENLSPLPLPQQSNGHCRSLTISVASRSKQELRGLRQKLAAELEQVRVMSKRFEAHEMQLGVALAGAPTPTGYAVSQFSATDANTPVAGKRMTEAPTPTGGLGVQWPQLSVNVVANENDTMERMEKEKRTPKDNQYYRNSEFLLAKDRFPPLDSHGGKKNKTNGLDVSAAEKKIYTQAFKSCSALLSRLMKHKHGWVFNQPVDVKLLGLHDYFAIIKHPMDLGTVRSRLSKNWYNLPRDFAEDVRLTFRNAMTYNPKGHDVHIMAEQLLQIFEERWAAIEAESTYVPYLPATKRPPPLDLRTLEGSDSTVHPVAVEPKKKATSHPTRRMAARKKPKAKDLNKRDMTLEEKQKLSSNLTNLPPEKLETIVQIIQKKNLSMSQHDDEIEIDIDSVDVETLWELDRFVSNFKKSLSKYKRRAEIAMLARQRAERNAQEMRQERVPEPIAEVPEKNVTASKVPSVEEKKTDNANGDSSSSSSSSDSGSSSGSDSDSSSGDDSDAAHSPRT